MSSSTNRKRKAVEMEEDKDINEVGPVRYMRDVPPAHYIFKIESFSTLSNTQPEKYESDGFESGGYKWRLSLYPNGDKKREGDGYISLYLEIVDADTFPHGWEVFANFRLFVFNQMQDKYLTVQVDNASIKRFHGVKREWGFAQLLSLSTFNDVSNGYLVKDFCIFGAEVYVIKRSGKLECLSMVKQPLTNTFTWKIEQFSKLDKKHYYSKVFTVGEAKWTLRLYPKGYSIAKYDALSVYLQLDDCSSLPPYRKLYAKYKLRIRDQVYSIHHEFTGQHWFWATSLVSGNYNLLKLSDLNSHLKGFLKNDTLIVEAQIMVMSVVKFFS